MLSAFFSLPLHTSQSRPLCVTILTGGYFSTSPWQQQSLHPCNNQSFAPPGSSSAGPPPGSHPMDDQYIDDPVGVYALAESPPAVLPGNDGSASPFYFTLDSNLTRNGKVVDPAPILQPDGNGIGCTTCAHETLRKNQKYWSFCFVVPAEIAENRRVCVNNSKSIFSTLYWD